MGVEEAGWAPVPQVTRRCYNPQRRPLKAANVRRCQLQVVPPSVPLLSASFSSSSSSRGVIFYFFAGEIYSVNRESGVFDPNPGPFILSPMWVSGSQPSSHWQIIQKQNEKKTQKTRWLDELLLSRLEQKTNQCVSCPCSKVDTDVTKQKDNKNPSEPCQYILIFCIAEKQRLDTPSHCLENNFTPRSNLTYRRRTPHRLRRGN